MPTKAGIGKDLLLRNRSGTHDVCESCAEVRAAADLIGTDQARRLGLTHFLRSENDHVSIASPIAEGNCRRPATVSSPAQTPVEAHVVVPGGIESLVLRSGGTDTDRQGRHQDGNNYEKTRRSAV